MDKNNVKTKISNLVDKYEEVKKSGKIKNYTEEETKKDFIERLFEALGWNIYDKREVSAEEFQKSGGRVDYGFYLDGRAKFYLEAKSLSTDLNREEFARQAIKYSWNKGITWAVLTDFESIKVFNAQYLSPNLGDKLFFEITYDKYLEQFDRLWLLSKESFEKNLLDLEGEKYGKKLATVSVNKSLIDDLNTCREILTRNLAQWNPTVHRDLLDEGVQKLLDRLIFIRVAEDRGVEPETLIPLVREWESGGRKTPLYQSMISKFRELDKIYDSNLFSEHPFETWDEDGTATKKVINILYGKAGYYEYDFKFIPADVLGSVYENYLGYKLSQLKKNLTISKDARKRKEGGIYYTPDYIVDFIVKNTLKPVLDRCGSIEAVKKLKVLDPACGSGAFLIKALNLINEKYEEFGYKDEYLNKLQILTENIYGVDLDKQAVEIARLNLLINSLSGQMKLPLLNHNIKNGNSLISGTDEELKEYFGNNYRDKNPFNWEEQFPEVFKQGGFDVIIGNPPYINSRGLDSTEKIIFEKKFETAKDQYDLYALFVEKSIFLLKENGRLGFIVPNKFLVTKYGIALKEYLTKNAKLLTLKDYSAENVFNEASVYPIVMILNKQSEKCDSTNFDVQYKDLLNISANKTDLLLKKIETIPNRVSLKVWRPLATAREIKVGNKTIISNREVSRYTLNESVTGTIENASQKDSVTNKIILKKLCFNLEAALDQKGFLTINTTYCVQTHEQNVDIKFILAILNSKLMTFYARNTYSQTALRGGYIELRVYQVQLLPIKYVSGKEQGKIVEYVDKIIDLFQEQYRFERNSEKWNSIKEELEKTDKKIDQEVYKLYGLTPEEIEIVKNKSN